MAPRASLFLATLVLLAACRSAPEPRLEHGVLEIRAVAGPTCPVEQVPPDPGCEPRPVAGARILVSPGDGRDIVVAEGVTDSDGTARIELPPGQYIVTGTEVDGLFGLPGPTPVTIGADTPASATLTWDTGIR